MNAVSRLTLYLKEVCESYSPADELSPRNNMVYFQSEARLKAETTLREQLAQEVSQTASVVNSIATVRVPSWMLLSYLGFTRVTQGFPFTAGHDWGP